MPHSLEWGRLPPVKEVINPFYCAAAASSASGVAGGGDAGAGAKEEAKKVCEEEESQWEDCESEDGSEEGEGSGTKVDQEFKNITCRE